MNNNDVSINTAISAILSSKEILKDNKASSLSALLLFGGAGFFTEANRSFKENARRSDQEEVPPKLQHG
ncbi:hypothetical protein [Paracoccus marcusii]|uniref:hypothetical protein n=1 Tax=Paracoccus marcusii TaxID=59779 RepID=UPI0035A5CFBE